MAQEVPVLQAGIYESAADLSGDDTNQFRAVKITADNTVGLSGDGELSEGILQNLPTAGEAAEVMSEGISKGRLGATVVAGAKLAPDAAGKLITAASGKHPLAVAVQGGDADNVVTVRLMPSAVPLA